MKSADLEPSIPPSRRPIRVALVGCGKMGLQHLRAIGAVPGATVVGVADPAADEEALRDLLPADALVLGDALTLIERARPDVVHVVTPPATHTAAALLAIDAGCHVYVEKPFAATRAEAEQVIRRAEERGVQVCAGHQCLFERPALEAFHRLAEVGRLVHVESYSSFRMVRRTITHVDQAKDILPHAVYPLTALLRAGTGLTDAPIQVVGLDVRATGDVYGLLRLGDCTGILVVTLSGRPIEQYQHIVGTGGWMRADYVTGALTHLAGPGAGVGVLFTPYRRGWQTLAGATSGIARLITERTSYPGLRALIGRFYAAIATGAPPPLTPRSILDTVEVCAHIGTALDAAGAAKEAEARSRLADVPPTRGSLVLVTGGTGWLGRSVAEELRGAGFRVRSLGRRPAPYSARVPCVEYVTADLACPLDTTLLQDVDAIVHCAAETAGGKREHERGSVDATRHLVEAAAKAGVRAIVHISSLAVLKAGRAPAGGLDESCEVDRDGLRRGPYVWGKAESELLARRLGGEVGIPVKVIRPGPLVDYGEFQPPGRLGREVGPIFVAVGGRRSPLSVCDVRTAARVIRRYVQAFDAEPDVLNLVEAPAPTRGELVARLKQVRPDLRVLWVPAFLLRVLAAPLKLAQRLALGSTAPVDVYAAFASERYRTDLAAEAIARAGASAVPAPSRAFHPVVEEA